MTVEDRLLTVEDLSRALHETAKAEDTPEDRYIEINSDEIAEAVFAFLEGEAA